MSGYSEEEFQSFIKQNRDLIERMMSLQKQAAVETLSAGREIAHEAVGSAVEDVFLCTFGSVLVESFGVACLFLYGSGYGDEL